MNSNGPMRQADTIMYETAGGYGIRMRRNRLLTDIVIITAVTCMLTGCGDLTAGQVQQYTEESTEDIQPTEYTGEDEMNNNPATYYYDTSAPSVNDSNSAFMQPMLQNPTKTGVTVQWFTEYEGVDNRLYLYDSCDPGEIKAKLTDGTDEDIEAVRVIDAVTYKMSRLRGGKSESDYNNQNIDALIYKHVAVVDDLPEYHGNIDERRAYRVATDDETSGVYTLAAIPAKGTPMRILLTSDQQMKPMCAANYQMVIDTVGHVDAVFSAGDHADVPDRAYDWMYSGNGFMRTLTGTASNTVNDITYHGAPILQSAPVFTAIGNHDVMGIMDNALDLSFQFNYPYPRKYALELWESVTPNAADVDESDKDLFIENHSYNTHTYEEMFELPRSEQGGERYYAVTIGDIRLIVLEVSRIWRSPQLGTIGKYSEIPGATPNLYGYGDFIFEDVSEDSDQIAFLRDELASAEYKDAKYHVVMFHNESHSLGDNQIPPFTDPVPGTVTDPVTGQKMTVYDYPIERDYINTIIEPLLMENAVDLEFVAHSHVWNRFATSSGMNVLETSNVGNNYGGFMDSERTGIPSALKQGDKYSSIASAWDSKNYVSVGDPYGLEPIAPNVAPLPDDKPYLASDTVTAFSILDTGKGTVDSYYYDTANPDGGVVLFDSFALKCVK